MKCIIIVTIYFIMSNFTFAQQNNLHLMFMNGDTLNQISFEELIEDSVKISNAGQSQWIKVDSISEIRKTKESKFWQGVGYGFLGGAAFGALVGAASYKKPSSRSGFNFSLGRDFSTAFGAVVGGVAGGLVGGAVGASPGKDEVYDLSQEKFEQKIEIIRSIIAIK